MNTSDLTMWTLIVSALLPALVAVIQQPRWSVAVRTTVAVITSVIAGGLTVYFTTPVLFHDGSTMTTVILTVIVASKVAYEQFWKPTAARTIEHATSPTSDETHLIEGAKADEANEL